MELLLNIYWILAWFNFQDLGNVVEKSGGSSSCACLCRAPSPVLATPPAQEHFQVSRAVQVKVGEEIFYCLLELDAARDGRKSRQIHLVQTFRVPEAVSAAMQLPGPSDYQNNMPPPKQ